MEFAYELFQSDQLNQYNVDNLNKLSARPAKQRTLIEVPNYSIDSQVVDGSTYEWYYLSIERAVVDLIDSKPEILSALIAEKNRPIVPGLYKGFKDGSFYQDEPGVIPVYVDLYVDECSKTQSSSDSSSMVIVYLTINNVPYFLQSSREEIQLIMIGSKRTYKAVQRDRFWFRIVNELRDLQSKRIQFNDTVLIIRLSAIAGDNLALNALQGISCGFYRTYACRSCNVHYDHLQTLEQFDRYEAERLLDQNHLLAGVVDRRFLLYLHDFYHDFVEGVLPKFLLWLIKRWYKKNDVALLNSNIRDLSWHNGRIHYLDPKLNGFQYTSGMQMLEFFVQFSLIDIAVTDTHPDYQMYLNLRRIVSVLLRLELTQADLELLHENVEAFLRNFIETGIRELEENPNRPRESVTFKMHYLLHYKKAIECCGPIWTYCTLRYERAHQMLMNYVRTPNNVNLEKQIISWYLIDKQSRSERIINCKFQVVTITDPRLAQFVGLNARVKEFSIYQFKKVSFERNKYYIVSDSVERIEFGRCFRIFEDGDVPKIIFQRFNIDRFSESRYCYQVTPTEQLMVLDPDRAPLSYLTLFSAPKRNSASVYIQKTF